MKVSYVDVEILLEVILLLLLKEFFKFCNVVIIIVVIYLGMFNGLYEFFGFWYLDDFGVKFYMLGVVFGLCYIIVMFVYFVLEVFIIKFGYVCVIVVSLVFYVVVYFGLVFVFNFWLGVVLYSVQGLLYGIIWVVCVVFGGIVFL